MLSLFALNNGARKNGSLAFGWVAGHSDLTQDDERRSRQLGQLTRHKVEDGNQVPGGPVAAGSGFGGLDERIDRLDTAVGETGIERIEGGLASAS